MKIDRRSLPVPGAEPPLQYMDGGSRAEGLPLTHPLAWTVARRLVSESPAVLRSPRRTVAQAGEVKGVARPWRSRRCVPLEAPGHPPKLPIVGG